MTIQDIKDELQEVKYYYGHKAMFDRALSTVSKNKVLEKVARYNDLVQDAPAQLFGLYVAIYTENNTQLAVALDWGLSEGYIKNLNRKLCGYLLEKINEKEGKQS